MPIDPKRLAKMAGAVKPPEGRRFGLAAKPKAATAPKEAGTAEDEDQAMLEDEEAGDEENPNPGAVVPFLEMYPQEVQACMDEVDADLLIDPEMVLDEANAKILQEGCLDLPPRLQRLLPNFVGITYEDAAVIGAALVDREKAEDAELVSGWIFRVGQVLGGDYESAEGDPDAEEEA